MSVFKTLIGKTAIITGASSGIGAATATVFAKLGASIALTGRKVERLDQVAEKCLETNSNTSVITIPADLCSENDNCAIIKKTVDHFGKLDILVNNAGIMEFGSIEQTSLDQYDRLMNTNVRAMYHLIMLAVPQLIQTEGNIVNVSSVNGVRSFAGLIAYNISKAAVDQMTRCVALELASKQVRVNCVNPGVVITELQKRAGLTDEAYTQFLERSKTTHALGRPGQPNEVASAIAYLASNEASFITGVSLPVDGGRHAMCPR